MNMNIKSGFFKKLQEKYKANLDSGYIRGKEGCYQARKLGASNVHIQFYVLMGISVLIFKNYCSQFLRI